MGAERTTRAGAFRARVLHVFKAHGPILLSAILVAFAARYGHALLGTMGLVPLFASIHGDRPLTALRRGGLWGTVFAGLMLAGLGAEDLTPAALVMLPVSAGLYCGLGAWLTRRVGFSPFVLGVGWMAVELSLIPAGLRVGVLAATQGEGWLMGVIGPALGYVLVAFVVAVVNAALMELIVRVSADASSAYRTCACEAVLRNTIQSFGRPAFHLLEPSRPRAPPA